MLARLRQRPRAQSIAAPPCSEEAAGSSGANPGAANTTSPVDPVTRMGVLWSPEWDSDPTASFRGSGVIVACRAWMQAVIRYGQIPKVDIFVPFGGMDSVAQQFRGVQPRTDSQGGRDVGFVEGSDLSTQLRTHHYDALHDPHTDLLLGSYARACFSRHVFPVTCSQHAISYSVQLHGCFIPQLTAQVYRCDAIVCLSHSARSAMEKRLGDIAERYSRAWDRPASPLPRLELIPWGVDTEFFAPRDQATARRDLNLPLDRPIILCLGRVRIEDKMDFTPLLLAFERVARGVKQRPLFVLAGSTFSGYGNEVVAQAGQLGLGADLRTFFNLPPACLPSLYAACDVTVAPTDSPSESFGLTIVEAMACGRPVVASDWDGYKELIAHGQTGFKARTDWADCLGEVGEMALLLPSDQQHLHVGQSVSVDVAQMAGFLSLLVENPDLRQEMGLRARQRAEALYDWSLIIGHWKALWGELRAIARTITIKEEARLDFLRPNFFAHFAHYPSRIVDDATPARLTPRGQSRLAGKVLLFPHPRAQDYLRPQYLNAVLSALKSVDRIGFGLPIGKLIEILGKLHGLSRDRALMHLMWLAKYDLISLGVEK